MGSRVDQYSHMTPLALAAHLRLDQQRRDAASSSPQTSARPESFGRQDQSEPPRFELFLLGDGEQKITVVPDTRVASAATFIFVKEDHTLANLLRSRLVKNEHVVFSGYRVPHPLVPTFELRVQTDGTLTPREAIVQACRETVQDLDVLGREFTKEWELKRIAKAGEASNGI